MQLDFFSRGATSAELAMQRHFTARSEPVVAAEDFGEKGKRAWFWSGNSWQVGRAWSVDAGGFVNGMCRDYGEWGVPYPGSAPCETHGQWTSQDVSWKRPPHQYQH